MKKKILLPLMALAMAVPNFAQTDDSAPMNIDFEEDTTQVVSLNDIISMQNLVSEKSFRNRVIKNVWKHKKFLSLSYTNATMTGDKIWLYNPTTKKMGEQEAEYSNDWGVALKRSQVVAFHKKPIADMLSFGLEYSFFDIACNHYAKDEDMRYDSRLTYEEKKDDDDNNSYYGSEPNEYHYTPWGSEMYNFVYAMHLGPSITLAPFTKLNSPGLAAIRLQGYFTAGYRASLLWMKGDSKQDVNEKGTNKEQEAFKEVDKSSKLSIGHGVVTNWGIRLNWKRIGVGYEVTKGNYKYQSLDKTTFGSMKHKFSDTTRRISIFYVW